MAIALAEADKYEILEKIGKLCYLQTEMVDVISSNVSCTA